MIISRTAPASRSLALLLALVAVSFAALSAFVSPADATTRRFSTNTGTSSSGYLWTNQGPDIRDDSTNFGAGMKWKLQIGTSGVVNSESYMQNAINAINAQSPGVVQQWGGLTSATSVPTCPTCSNYENAWLVRIVPTESIKTVCAGWTTQTMGCAKSFTSSTDGGATFNVTSCIVYIDATKYKAGGSLWHGAFRHEMLHCIGLNHNTGTYNGVRQLMYPTVTQNHIQAGDANGIRALTRRV